MTLSRSFRNSDIADSRSLISLRLPSPRRLLRTRLAFAHSEKYRQSFRHSDAYFAAPPLRPALRRWISIVSPISFRTNLAKGVRGRSERKPQDRGTPQT